MASLAQAMHAFQSGALSHREFLARIDSALASDRSNLARLTEMLGEERTRIGLPPDVYSELQRRVRHVAPSMQPAGDEETRMRTGPSERPGSVAPPADGMRTDGGADLIKGVGDTLNGRFVLEECIGFGGMGTVYKALDLRKQEASDRMPYIAIKVLNVQFRGHPKSLIALQREARKAQTLAHPNIVTVYDFDRDGSMVYLTMEYLSGKPLSRVLRTPGFAGLPYHETLRIIDGVGRALSYAHERGFVHCDLKPANVFLTDRGEVKVIDFGIARVFRKSEEDAEATVFDAGSLGGMTPAYASPEVIERLEPDPRDDIYALGCITYELLTGRHPFDRLPAAQARGNGMKPSRPKKLGYRQWRALKAALAFERAARVPSVARFVQQMRPAPPFMVYAGRAAVALAVAALGVGGVRYYQDYRDARIESSGGSSGSSGAATTDGASAAPATPPVEPPLSVASIAPLLAGVPCSALAPSVRGQELRVQGYVGKSFGIDRLRDMLDDAPGVSALSLDVRQVGEHACPVIETFAPYWKGSRGTGISLRVRAPNAELSEGQPLIVDIKSPGYDSHVYVDYYVLDGNVSHLLPSVRARANQAPPHHEAVIGGLGNWVISKPFGAEMIVLLATPVPLFDGLRPDYEPGQAYLKAAQKRLGEIAAKYGPGRIAVDFVQITTRERGR
ncbi:MAG TPA: protein kinase [Paucimonas sp.]|nr:protein kinase [Paucimonas sp.]